MAKKIFRVKPLEHLMALGSAPINAPVIGAQWPTKNVMVSSGRVERRWDHVVYRTFDDEEIIQYIPVFRKADNTNVVLALTEKDLCEITTGSGETYKYRTETWAEGAVTGIVGAVVTGNINCQWYDSSGIAAGDKFIMNDDHSSAVELDTNWAEVKTVDSNTQITLTATYTGSATSGSYKVRKVYSVPEGERWQFASVNGNFCFTNGGVYAQYWNGTSSYASNIDTTYASQARYCIGYADRLVLADVINSGTRDPWLVRTSKNGDPTDFTDSTAVDYNFIETEEPITGLGIVGGQLVVFKKTEFIPGCRTGTPTDPLTFPNRRRGVGLYAPYSLVHYMGTVAFLGVDDFYTINGDIATSIGADIRKKFFDIVDEDDISSVFGVNNVRYYECIWVAKTSSGQAVFSWNYKDNTWSVHEFDSDLTGVGDFVF